MPTREPEPGKKRCFEELGPTEVLSLAIHVERANARRFRTFADAFRGYDAAVTQKFEELATEEDRHEAMLADTFGRKFSGSMPVVEEGDVLDVIESVDLDDAEHQIFDSMTCLRVYEVSLAAERQARSFYEKASAATTEADLAALYRELAGMEDDHVDWLESRIRSLREASSR